MNLVKKIKDILFEVEEDENENTDVIKVKEKDNTIENLNASKEKEEIKEEVVTKNEEIPSERELFKVDSNTFTFPDFDEEEFQSNYAKNVELEDRSKDKINNVNNNVREQTQFRSNNNVLDFERKKNAEKRNEYQKHERSLEKEERVEKKK